MSEYREHSRAERYAASVGVDRTANDSLKFVTLMREANRRPSETKNERKYVGNSSLPSPQHTKALIVANHMRTNELQIETQ